jgi:acyl carrier protein
VPTSEGSFPEKKARKSDMRPRKPGTQVKLKFPACFLLEILKLVFFIFSSKMTGSRSYISPTESEVRMHVFTRDEVSRKISEIIADALSITDEDIVPTASLNGDLGAESIDWLDITFRLERAFTTDPEQKLMIEREDLFPIFWTALIDDPKYIEHGRMTELGMDFMRQRYPNADLRDMGPTPRFDEVRDRIITVAYVESYMFNKLGI